MRIIAGKYRAKKLVTPKNANIRPTEDRVREAIFSILYSKLGTLEGKSVVDVFAGTGALGFEALSRGAKNVCFIDKDVEILKRNAMLFEKEKDAFKILCTDVLSPPYIQSAFDVIFSDAPYDQGLNEKGLLKLQQKGYFKNNTVCVIETRKTEDLYLPESFQLIDERTYGMAKIRFYTFLE